MLWAILFLVASSDIAVTGCHRAVQCSIVAKPFEGTCVFFIRPIVERKHYTQEKYAHLENVISTGTCQDFKKMVEEEK